MSNLRDKYQVVIGLEVHAQLSTNTKAYCSDSTLYMALRQTRKQALFL